MQKENLSANRIKIGCAGFPVNQKTYLGRLGMVEASRVPRPATAEKWRQSSPTGFEFVLRTSDIIPRPRPVGNSSTRRPRAFDESWEAQRILMNIETCAAVLESKLLLFDFPSSFSPTADNVGRLQRFFKALPAHKLSYLWDAPFSWSPTLVSDVSKSLHLTPVINPLRTPAITFNGLRYIRVRKKTLLSDKELGHIAEATRGSAYVVFDTGPTSFKEALRFSSRFQPC